VSHLSLSHNELVFDSPEPVNVLLNVQESRLHIKSPRSELTSLLQDIMVENRNVTHLDLSRNRFTENGATVLAQKLRNPPNYV
jgi:hypothetical protein